MKKLTLIGVAAVALSLTLTACSSSDGSNGGAPAHTTSSTQPASSRPSSTAPSYGPPTSQPAQTTSAPTTKPPAKTTKPATTYPGCETVANTAAAPACADYLRYAAPARVGYYRFARSSDTALAKLALKGLNNWYTGSSRSLVLGQVSSWNPNYSDNIDVDHTTKVTGGQGATSAGVATLKVVETWKVYTEGGPVETKDEKVSVWDINQHYTITLLRHTGGWGVSTIVKG
jgi:hypothetical protein